MSITDQVIDSSYPVWAKWRRVAVTIPFFIVLIFLAYLYDLELSTPMMLGSLLLGVNVWLDIRDLTWYRPLRFDSEAISGTSKRMSWDDVQGAWRFGPKIDNRWKGLARRLFFQQGIVLVSDKEQFVIFSSATHYEELYQWLERKRIPIRLE